MGMCKPSGGKFDVYGPYRSNILEWITMMKKLANFCNNDGMVQTVGQFGTEIGIMAILTTIIYSHMTIIGTLQSHPANKE